MTRTHARRSSRTGDRRGPLLVLCVIFIIVGLLSATLGPTLPDLAKRTGGSLGELGRLFSALFAGSLVAQLLGGRASDRFGRRIILVLGCLLGAAGAVGVAASRSMWLTLGAASLLGFGFAGATLSVNVMAAELSPRRRASAVNLVNLFYGMGAIAGPLVAGLFLERTGAATPALWISVALLLLMVPLALRTLPASTFVPPAHPPSTAALSPPAANPRAFVFACGLFLMIYVGLEWAIGAWAAVYLQRSTGLDAAGAATATAVYWFALSSGRMLAVLVGMNLAAERLISVTVGLALIGGLVLWLGHGLASASIAALAIIGVAFGPIYPTGIAIVTVRFPHAAGTATSQIGVHAAVGGMALPWLLGMVLTHGTTLDAARLMLALTGLMLVLWWRVYQLERRALHTPAHRP